MFNAEFNDRPDRYFSGEAGDDRKRACQGKQIRHSAEQGMPVRNLYWVKRQQEFYQKGGENYMQDKSPFIRPKEIAEELDMKPNSVRVALKRARAELLEYLEAG